ncbi:MAG: saccharopine dehydrogenase, partial [Myxococcota bacterium]
GRSIASTVLPAPGEGPSPELREQGYFKGTLVGKGENAQGRPVEVRVKINGKRDPGYGATARMLGEAAVCLAKDRDLLPEQAGILTPSTAMGDALVQRLESNAEVTFEAKAWS